MSMWPSSNQTEPAEIKCQLRGAGPGKRCRCQTVAAYKSASQLTLRIKRCTGLAALANIYLSL